TQNPDFPRQKIPFPSSDHPLLSFLRPRGSSIDGNNGRGRSGEDDRRGEGGAGAGHVQGARRLPVLWRPRGGDRRGERAAHPVPPAVPQEQAQVLLHQVFPPPRHHLQLDQASSSSIDLSILRIAA
uniref:Uncharacterized protein n=1 Tax=Triticum urartu TaxID=4572 RepID=A0A8R7PIR4_TRIUA